jgi:hypothetical protein
MQIAKQEMRYLWDPYPVNSTLDTDTVILPKTNLIETFSIKFTFKKNDKKAGPKQHP